MMLTLFTAFTASSWAHPGHSNLVGFSEGMTHPLGGWDHLLAMIAVGLWAFQLGAHARWLVPSCFVGMMTLGSVVGISGFSIPWSEQGIALSVMLLGLFVATTAKLPSVIPALLVGGFALFHGAAHGSEMPATASGLYYSLGFILSTVALHGVGLGLGFFFERKASLLWVRSTGAGIAAVGTYLFVGAFL